MVPENQATESHLPWVEAMMVPLGPIVRLLLSCQLLQCLLLLLSAILIKMCNISGMYHGVNMPFY